MQLHIFVPDIYIYIYSTLLLYIHIHHIYIYISVHIHMYFYTASDLLQQIASNVLSSRRKASAAPPERPKSAGSRWGTRVERGFYEEGRCLRRSIQQWPCKNLLPIHVNSSQLDVLWRFLAYWCTIVLFLYVCFHTSSAIVSLMVWPVLYFK